MRLQERSALADTRLNEALESIENQAYVLNSLRSGLEDTNTNLAASLDRTDTLDLRLKALAETVNGLDLEGRYAAKTSMKALEEQVKEMVVAAAAAKPAATAVPRDLEERLGGFAAGYKTLDLAVGDLKSRGDQLEGKVKEIRQQLEGLEEVPKQVEEMKALQSKVCNKGTVGYYFGTWFFHGN